MPLQVTLIVRFNLPIEISQSYADHLTSLACSGRNGFAFLFNLFYQVLCTSLLLAFYYDFTTSDFPTLTGLQLSFGYVFSFGLFISWVGFVYLLRGIATGALYLPVNPNTYGAYIFHCDVRPTGHALARGAYMSRRAQLIKVMMVDLGRLLYMLVIYMGLGVGVWRRWKWSDLSTDLWLSSVKSAPLPMENLARLNLMNGL